MVRTAIQPGNKSNSHEVAKLTESAAASPEPGSSGAGQLVDGAARMGRGAANLLPRTKQRLCCCLLVREGGAPRERRRRKVGGDKRSEEMEWTRWTASTSRPGKR